MGNKPQKSRALAPTKTWCIPLTSVRAADLAPLGASETAGDHFLNLFFNTIAIDGEEAISETETSVSWFEWAIPPDWNPGSPLYIVADHELVGSGTAVVSTIDFNAYKHNRAGNVGSNLVTTPAATIGTSVVESEFAITATDLTFGDKINVKMTTSVTETAASAVAARIPFLGMKYEAVGN